MAWTTPLTAVANATLTAAQWNASVRDNLLTTSPALASAAGSLFVATGTNAIAQRTPTATHIAASCTSTTTATYGAPTTGTAGPVVSGVTTGTNAIVAVGALMQGTAGANMSYAVSGASTIAAVDAWSIQVRPPAAAQNFRYSSVYLHSAATTPLTAGSNTFTAQYTTPTGGTGTFAERHLLVIPL